MLAFPGFIREWQLVYTLKNGDAVAVTLLVLDEIVQYLT